GQRAAGAWGGRVPGRSIRAQPRRRKTAPHRRHGLVDNERCSHRVSRGRRRSANRKCERLMASGDQMLDIVARILPAAATIAFASLSVFNVGYFWKIGLHFLGIVDLNNIVYSFGLTFGLWMVLVFVGLEWVDIFSEPVSETSIRRSMRTSKFVAWIGATLFVLASFTPEKFGYEIVLAGVALVGLILLWGAWSVRSLLDYKTSGTAKAHDLAFLVLVPFVIFFNAGTSVAAWQMTQRDTYTITTISASIENAHLLRTS